MAIELYFNEQKESGTAMLQYVYRKTPDIMAQAMSHAWDVKEELDLPHDYITYIEYWSRKMAQGKMQWCRDLKTPAAEAYKSFPTLESAIASFS